MIKFPNQENNMFMKNLLLNSRIDVIKNHLIRKKFIYLAGVFAFVLVILIFIGYKKGYRFQENFMIGKIGFLSMEVTLPQTNIFIDESQKIVTSKENEIVEVPLSPRRHSVIVSRDGYFPWKKVFSVPSDGIVNFSPLFVSNNPSGMIITTKDPEFWKIRNKIITDALPTLKTPRISKDGTTKLWMDNNAIIVEVASSTKTVIQPNPAIKNLYFYKDRSDVVVFSVSNAIYAIEINKEGNQNFLPIYKGVDPDFIEGGPNSIYVMDGETLMQVVI